LNNKFSVITSLDFLLQTSVSDLEISSTD